VEGKVALVMGASKGIGRGCAVALAREGASVAVSARSEDALEELAAELGGGARAFPAESGDLERMESLPDEIEKAMGSLDILVTNTGGPPPGGALDNPREEWEGAYRTLVLSPRVLVEAALTPMRERGWGRIVNVASSSVKEPIPGLALSNAHRMALVGLFKTLATEVAGDGVTVNTVATGRFATDRLRDAQGSLESAHAAAREQIPAGRLGEPAEYGDLVAFLCSERAAYLTGAVIPLDGGRLRSA
jgi:3-oxoacyl-[acyl-carrier protein] reductase